MSTESLRQQIVLSELRESHAIGLSAGESSVMTPACDGLFHIVIDMVSLYYHGDSTGGWIVLSGYNTGALIVGVVGDSASPHYHQLPGPFVLHSGDNVQAEPINGTWDITLTWHWEQAQYLPGH